MAREGGEPEKNWGEEGEYAQSMLYKIHKEQGRSLQKEGIKRKKKVKGLRGGVPSDFNEFLPVPKQGCWPLSKLLAVPRNQPCILGANRRKAPLGGPRRLKSPALAWLGLASCRNFSKCACTYPQRPAWSQGSQAAGVKVANTYSLQPLASSCHLQPRPGKPLTPQAWRM